MPIDAKQPYDDSNIFARILRGELPAKTVMESEAVLGLHDPFSGQFAAQDAGEDIAVVIGLLGIDGHFRVDSGLTAWPPSLPRKSMTDEPLESLLP
jgi:hypothetical protein